MLDSYRVWGHRAVGARSLFRAGAILRPLSESYLVSVKRHPELVPDPEQQQAALSAVDCRLTDQLVETLGVELAPRLLKFTVLHCAALFSSLY
jgi:hypothetical protein